MTDEHSTKAAATARKSAACKIFINTPALFGGVKVKLVREVLQLTNTTLTFASFSGCVVRQRNN